MSRVVDNEIRKVIKGDAFGFYYKWGQEHIERFRIVECLDLTHVLKAHTLLPCEKQSIEGYTLSQNFPLLSILISVVFVESCVQFLHSPFLKCLVFWIPFTVWQKFHSSVSRDLFFQACLKDFICHKKSKGENGCISSISSSPFIEILYCIFRI